MFYKANVTGDVCGIEKAMCLTDSVNSWRCTRCADECGSWNAQVLGLTSLLLTQVPNAGIPFSLFGLRLLELGSPGDKNVRCVAGL